VQAKLTPADSRIIEQLLIEWEGAATDAAYWRAKAGGAWGSGNG
jgi:hypothetical protein